MKTRLALIVALFLSIFVFAQAQEEAELSAIIVQPAPAGGFSEVDGVLTLTIEGVPTNSVFVVYQPALVTSNYVTQNVVDDWAFTKEFTEDGELLTLPAILETPELRLELEITAPSIADGVVTYQATVVGAEWLIDSKDDPEAPETFADANLVITLDSASVGVWSQAFDKRINSGRNITAQSACTPTTFCSK